MRQGRSADYPVQWGDSPGGHLAGTETKAGYVKGGETLAEGTTFQQIEGKLYSFFEDMRKLELLEIQLAGVEKELAELQNTSSDTYAIAASMGLTVRYSAERVQGKRSVYCSPVEEAYLDICEQTEKLLVRRMKLTTRIINLRQNYAEIQYALSQLSPFDQEIVEYKYRYKMSTRQIGRIKGMHKNTIERQRQRIIEELGKVLVE
jgi:PP-loop superfamily ATP-utilizing enzyme